MKIQITKSQFGWGWSLIPLDCEWQRKIRLHLEKYQANWYGNVLVETSRDVRDAAIDFGLTEEEIEEIDNGWSVEKEVDVWTFLHYVGWNAHELVEG